MIHLHSPDKSEHLSWNIGRKSPLTWRFVPRLRRLLTERGADILHARSRVPAWVGYLAWRGMPAAARPRFVTTVHGVYSVNGFSRIMRSRIPADSSWTTPNDSPRQSRS